MVLPDPRSYLPLGCLLIENLPQPICNSWSESWVELPHHAMIAPNGIAHRFLDSQWQLRRDGVLKELICLCNAQWIRLSMYFSTSRKACLVRVYVLPDDVNRISVSRHDRTLRLILRNLMHHLNYSPQAWNGHFDGPWQRAPKPADDSSLLPTKGKGASLLAMFNEIPPPSPDMSKVDDVECRDAMEDLLSGQIYGITSTLFPYQARSAALMVQRESSPGKVIDPRLRKIRDHHGGIFYIDSVVGTVLREPRFYDEVAGGILAEEMGAGKTLICLALIAATKNRLVKIPDLHCDSTLPVRRQVGSLIDMAAATLTRHSISWKHYFEYCEVELGERHTACLDAITRNPGYYLVRDFELRHSSLRPKSVRCHRYLGTDPPPESERKIYLSSTSIIVVPRNLLQQWQQEIKKHTSGLKVLVVDLEDIIPEPTQLIEYDLLLFSQSRFERIEWDGYPDASGKLVTALSHVHFKRIIIDEGHRIGNSRIASKSRLLTVSESIVSAARWIVTGTPSNGLYGVENSGPSGLTAPRKDNENQQPKVTHASFKDEKNDLIKLGAIASLYLKARPWANNAMDPLDKRANWAAYVLQPKHGGKGQGDEATLREALQSLIIRHPLSEVKQLLPCVTESIVLLEGSYQDKLVLNLFASMIISNSVQSQRTDQDYFFHPKQRPALNSLVKNLKQSCFFGGCFFPPSDIAAALERAETFMEKKHVKTSTEDQKLLSEAMEFMRMILKNKIREASTRYHEVPLAVMGFPGPHAKEWAVGGSEGKTTVVCAPLLNRLKRMMVPVLNAPYDCMRLLTGDVMAEVGREAREALLGLKQTAVEQTRTPRKDYGAASRGPRSGGTSITNNLTNPGQDSNAELLHYRYKSVEKIEAEEDLPGTGAGTDEVDIPQPLQEMRIVATASAKLSYLVDAILKYHEEEQILVFYENDNVAWYIATTLETLQVKHLIYAKGLPTQLRAQYVATFNSGTDLPSCLGKPAKFRVMLMDISLAAFGLDMHAANRIYFVSPVLNPQVEAQAIGRARRISQRRPVVVETLVLKDSIEEVIAERRNKMSREEHKQCSKALVNDGPIREWILSSKLVPLGDLGHEREGNAEVQMARLKTPRYVFCRGGRSSSTRDYKGNVEKEEVAVVPESPQAVSERGKTTKGKSERKRQRSPSTPRSPSHSPADIMASGVDATALSAGKRVRVSFTFSSSS